MCSAHAIRLFVLRLLGILLFVFGSCGLSSALFVLGALYSGIFLRLGFFNSRGAQICHQFLVLFVVRLLFFRRFFSGRFLLLFRRSFLHLMLFFPSLFLDGGKQVFHSYSSGAPLYATGVSRLLQKMGEFLFIGNSFFFQELQNRQVRSLHGFQQRKKFAEYFFQLIRVCFHLWGSPIAHSCSHNQCNTRTAILSTASPASD